MFLVPTQFSFLSIKDSYMELHQLLIAKHAWAKKCDSLWIHYVCVLVSRCISRDRNRLCEIVGVLDCNK